MDIIIVMKIMYQHHSKNQAYDPGFIDERLMGPPGPPQGFPGRVSTFISTTGSRPRCQGQGQSGPPSSPPPSFVPAQTSHNKLEHLQWIQVALEDVYSDLRMYG